MAKNKNEICLDLFDHTKEVETVTPIQAEAFLQLRAARGTVKFAVALRKLKADR